MLKQKLVTTTVAAMLAFGVAQVHAADMLQKIGKGEGRVDIVAWPGYIERGETDPNFDWVTSFEKKTGCMVNIKTANTSDEMVALMKLKLEVTRSDWRTSPSSFQPANPVPVSPKLSLPL